MSAMPMPMLADLATALLVPAFSLVVLFAVLATARLVRSWREDERVLAGARGDGYRGGAGELAEDAEELALEDEKLRLLATLKDLDHERALGKLSDADHEGLKRHFEREVLRVLGRLDALRDAREADARRAQADDRSGS